jgi:hypothetical protein
LKDGNREATYDGADEFSRAAASALSRGASAHGTEFNNMPKPRSGDSVFDVAAARLDGSVSSHTAG